MHRLGAILVHGVQAICGRGRLRQFYAGRRKGPGRQRLSRQWKTAGCDKSQIRSTQPVPDESQYPTTTLSGVVRTGSLALPIFVDRNDIRDVTPRGGSFDGSGTTKSYSGQL